MSAITSTQGGEPGDLREVHDGETIVAGTPLVVRRRAGLAALIGAAASAVAIAYLWRASQTMTPLDWSLCAVMGLVAGYHLASLVDARTPLAVADDLGVRIRLGDEWRGLPWEAIKQVSVYPRRGALRDGRIVFVPHSLARAIDGLEGKAKRHAALNQKMYDAVLAVPVGITTRVSTSGGASMVDQISALSLGRAEVIEVAPEPTPQPTPQSQPEPTPEPKPEPEPRSERQPTGRPARGGMLAGLAAFVSRAGRSRGDEAGPEVAEGSPDPVTPADELASPQDPAADAGTVPLRATRRAVRAEVTRVVPSTLDSVSLHESDDSDDSDDSDEMRGFRAVRDWRSPGSVDLAFEPVSGGHDRVRPISALGAEVEPVVVEDQGSEPARNPVIGPQLAAARVRLGLSVDDLADRTRIRPHVIESIEVDDFAPCGGDFYARGHLRTLARVLGKDPAFLAAFEDLYATAPVNASRVFEAELATGMRGSMRSTIGRPNWGLLIGVVLSLILVWGVVRFFSAEPSILVQDAAPVLNGSAGLGSDPRAGPNADQPNADQFGPAARPMPLTLVAAHADTRLVVRNGDGKIVFSGALLLGEKKRLSASPPVRVQATDAGALEVSVRGRDKGVLGVLGERGRRTFG